VKRERSEQVFNEKIAGKKQGRENKDRVHEWKGEGGRRSGDALPTDRQMNLSFWGFPKEGLNAAQALEG
jgi:hypothetical protein